MARLVSPIRRWRRSRRIASAATPAASRIATTSGSDPSMPVDEAERPVLEPVVELGACSAAASGAASLAPVAADATMRRPPRARSRTPRAPSPRARAKTRRRPHGSARAARRRARGRRVRPSRAVCSRSTTRCHFSSLVTSCRTARVSSSTVGEAAWARYRRCARSSTTMVSAKSCSRSSGCRPRGRSDAGSRRRPHRDAAEIGDALRPQPGVAGLVLEVLGELHLRVGVVDPLQELQQQRRAAELGVTIVAEQREQIRIDCCHDHPVREGSAQRSPIYKEGLPNAIRPSRDRASPTDAGGLRPFGTGFLAARRRSVLIATAFVPREVFAHASPTRREQRGSW